jgi:radical SAM protein with 4Fe4S-binding SPASM domain
MASTYAVWELTLACNLGCVHCGSRAGLARQHELTTAEALDLVEQMAEVGVAEVTLIGGEAFLRSDWLEIVRSIRTRGMGCSLTTGGYGLSSATAQAMQQAGVQQVSVSIDGLQATHDFLRGRSGSWSQAFAAIERLAAAGIAVSCNTQLNRLSAPELVLLYEDIHRAGARAWQVALTVPMGRAADHPEILLQPWELLQLFPLLAELAQRAHDDGIFFMPGNNVGYYGPYERLLRSQQAASGEEAIWDGCQAGISSIGIEADGSIKGCPSLPTSAYTGGNVRSMPLSQILATRELMINAGMGTAAAVEHLWGFCAGCEFAALCRGGCTWTAHVLMGRPGNNPYCHHRALVHASQGLQETLVQVAPAEGQPFDHGRFELLLEPAQSQGFAATSVLRERPAQSSTPPVRSLVQLQPAPAR